LPGAMATDLRRRVAQGLGAPAAALVPGVALVWGAALGLLARNLICTVPPANQPAAVGPFLVRATTGFPRESKLDGSSYF
jgi:hypothetical protein